MNKILIAILFLHIVLLNNLNFTAWPEMLSYPYLLSKGFLLYKDFILPYPPTLVWILSAIFNFFGYDVKVLQIFTWILIIIVDILSYLVIRKISKNNFSAFFFLVIFILLQSFLDGNMLWFDFAMIIPLLAGFLFFLNFLDNNKLKYLFLTVVFLTLAVTIKQTAIIFLLAFFLYYFLVTRKFISKEIGILFLGCGLIFLFPTLYLAITGSVWEFCKWAILYPLTQWSKFPGYVNFAISKRYILVTVLLLLPIFAIPFSFKKIIRDKRFLLTSIFLVAALIAIYPRFSFFHLQPTIAFAVILFTLIFSFLEDRHLQKFIILVSVITIAIVGLVFKENFGNQVRFYTKSDQVLVKYIASLTSENERVYLLGLDASLYVHANRIPPKNWSDNFGWYLEIPGVQEWVLEGFRQYPPQIILRKTPGLGPWFGLATYQPSRIVEYIYLNYDKRQILREEVEVWVKKD